MTGTIRAARPEEMPSIIRIIDSVFRPDAGAVSMGVSFSHFLCTENADQIYVFETATGIASVVGTLRSWIVLEDSRLSVASVGSVCTLPSYRGNGLASNILQCVNERLKEEGILLMLVSGNHGLYRRQDCFEVGETCVVTVGEAGLSDQEQTAVTEYRNGDLREMLSVYNRERTRFERSYERFDSLLREQTYLSYRRAQPKILVHRSFDGIDSYAVVGILPREEQRCGEVVEFAGPDNEVSEILAYAQRTLELPSLVVPVPNYRSTLAELLIARGGTLDTQTISGTVKIIDFGRLWELLRPYLNSRMGNNAAAAIGLSTQADRIHLSLAAEVLSLDRKAAAHLIFNGPQMASFTPLKNLLSRAFPVPFVHTYNLNYV